MFNGIISADIFCNLIKTKLFFMSGRGDNNKKGSSGRGASKQSNQPFGEAGGGKSGHGKQTGGKPSMPQKKSGDQSADRNTSLDTRNDQ
jgi:hypothetical protein